MRLQYKVLTSIIVVLALVEISIRAAGLVDFPIFSVDSEIGYIPSPNQSGTFENRNRWVFNDKSMGIATQWNPALRPNLLLIGNSVIMGGDHFDQPQKLGPQLQDDIGNNWQVWPIAANGWTNVNEMVYLKRNPDVVASANFFVWEYMSGGLCRPSKWRGEYVFPNAKPIYATWYLFRRFVLPHVIALNMNALPPTGAVEPANLTNFQLAVAKLTGVATTKFGGGGIIFLYPKRAEYLEAKDGKDWLPERADIMQIASANHIQVVDIAQSPAWNARLYRSDAVHPTVAGNVVLAQILSQALQKGAATASK